VAKTSLTPVSVLMVCTGNICRSPTAEGVLVAKAARRGLRVRVDSAGTQDSHAGELPDARAIKHAARRGYDLSAQRARKVREADFHEFDYILAMDRGHLRYLLAAAPAKAKAKVSLFLGVSEAHRGQDVPDPYYGGDKGFELVLDMVEEACDHWLDQIERQVR
jgi:protein-tyrosine phosphatase